MTIDKELMNNQLQAMPPVHTGVYQSHERRCVVVVRVKEGHVHYMSFFDSTVQLHQSFTEKFLREFPIELHRYPALRALKLCVRYVREGFKCTPEARTVLRTIFKKG